MIYVPIKASVLKWFAVSLFSYQSSGDLPPSEYRNWFEIIRIKSDQDIESITFLVEFSCFLGDEWNDIVSETRGSELKYLKKKIVASRRVIDCIGWCPVGNVDIWI